jgi:hypothetical protein
MPDAHPVSLPESTPEAFHHGGATLLRGGIRALILTQAGGLTLALLFVGGMVEIGCQANDLHGLLWLFAGLLAALFLPFIAWLQQSACPARKTGCRLKCALLLLAALDIGLLAQGGLQTIAALANNSLVACDMDSTQPGSYHI